MSTYLQRLQILRHTVPPSPELHEVVIAILGSVLDLCGHTTKYMKMKRIKHAWRSLALQPDKEIQEEFDRFHMLILREEGIVRNLILVGVEELKINDAELKFHATSTLNVAQQSVALAMSTAAQLTCIRQATEDDSMHMEREAAIQWLSSLDVHQKQRRKFEERHKGTGRWFLQTNEFENWFSNPENSILWCHGDPGVGKSVMM
jgi:hypothetical protein